MDSMTKKFFTILVLLCVVLVSKGQEPKMTVNWNWLIGEWEGEGAGQPGQGSGSFTFSYGLDGKVIERIARTDFPATSDKPAFTHSDLLYVYTDFSGNLAKAIYFDNEGHSINYSVSYQDKSIIFLSEKIGNMPVFRLSYIPIDEQTVNVKFEMSRDGQTFMTYIEGKSKRTK